MNSKIGIWEWVVLYVIMIAIDIGQVIIDFIPVVGQILNEVLDPLIGIILALYLWFRGTLDIPGVIGFVIAVITKEGTLGALPAWTAVLIFINATTYFKKKAAAHPMLSKIASIATATSDPESVTMGTVGGKKARLPSKQQPLNQGGKRLPQ